MKDVQTKFEIKKVLVTPQFASRLLEYNTNNRRVKQPVVLRYANDMSEGRWKEYTGETIKTSISGNILDGQQRLLAVVKSGVSINFHVAFNVEDDCMPVIDTGSPRNACDSFTISGIKNSNLIPGIITMYNSLRDEQYLSVGKNFKATNQVLLDQYYSCPDFWQDITITTMRWYKSFAHVLSPMWIGGFYAYLKIKHENNSVEFMNQLCTGMGIENGSINLLRMRLMQNKLSSKKMSRDEKMALVIKTWNYYYTGKEVKVLKYNRFNDNFPKML